MVSKQWRFWLWGGAALVAGLALRLWFVRHLPVVQGDSLIYGGIAKDWLQYGVYGFNHETTSTGLSVVRPTLIRLPGYPIFLAACFRLFGMEHYKAVMYTQTIADLATCWLSSAVAGRLFGRRAALPVLWLAALCPFTANYVAAPLTETLVLTSIALTFYAFVRWQQQGGFNRWLWVIAVALAASVLLRPEQVLFAGAVLAAVAWASHTRQLSLPAALLPALAAAGILLLSLTPWVLRNARTFHVFEPLAPRYANDPGGLAPIGFARWYRTWAIEFSSTDEVYWNYDGERIRWTDLPPRAFTMESPSGSQDMSTRTAALLADYNITQLASRSIDDRFAALAVERVRVHPALYYFALPLARVADMVFRPRTEMMPVPDEWWRSKYPGKRAFAAAYAGLNLVYLALGAAGFLVWKRSGWSGDGPQESPQLALAMAASIVLRLLLLLTLDNAEPRYTLEFFPVLFMWAGALWAVPAGRRNMDMPSGR